MVLCTFLLVKYDAEDGESLFESIQNAYHHRVNDAEGLRI